MIDMLEDEQLFNCEEACLRSSTPTRIRRFCSAAYSFDPELLAYVHARE